MILSQNQNLLYLSQPHKSVYMDNKFKLVKKYNIDVDVYANERSDIKVDKLPDDRLTKEFLRFYFMGKIVRVWKEWSDLYYALTTKGEKIFLSKSELSFWEIERILNDKRGGKRAGAGSKLKTGYSTTTIRIPACIKKDIQCYIDMFSHYYNYTDKELPYYTDEEKRLASIMEMMNILEYEKRQIIERRKRAAEEEQNKRQLKLFGDENQ